MSESLKVPNVQGSDGRIVRAIAQLRTLLVPDETLEGCAVQRRLFAFTHRRIIVGATSGRLIVMTRGFFGGFQPKDIRWQDLKDARIKVGAFGADLTIGYCGSSDLTTGSEIKTTHVAGLQKAGAQEIYRICQAQEQAWREKRRIRELEELRAKSGGVHLSQPMQVGGPPSSAGVGDSGDPAARLQQAKELREKGLITDAEHETLKAKIVSGL